MVLLVMYLLFNEPYLQIYTKNPISLLILNVLTDNNLILILYNTLPLHSIISYYNNIILYYNNQINILAYMLIYSFLEYIYLIFHIKIM